MKRYLIAMLVYGALSLNVAAQITVPNLVECITYKYWVLDGNGKAPKWSGPQVKGNAFELGVFNRSIPYWDKVEMKSEQPADSYWPTISVPARYWSVHTNDVNKLIKSRDKDEVYVAFKKALAELMSITPKQMNDKIKAKLREQSQ